MRKINFLQIIIHFIATCFFIFSFQSFAYLYDLKIMKLCFENGVEYTLKNPEKYGIGVKDIWNFTFAINISEIIGVLFAFAISLIISIKYKWSKINSFIVLIISFLLVRFDFLSWNSLPRFLIPGHFINDIFFKFFISGIVFLLIGFTIFILKQLNEIIDNQSIK